MAGALIHVPTGRTLVDALDGRAIARTSGISPLSGGGADVVVFGLTVTTPAEAVLGAFVLLTGTYIGPVPGGVSYSIDGGVSWIPTALFNATGGLWSGLGPPLPFLSNLTVLVRNASVSAIGAASAAFQVGLTASAAVTTALTIATPDALNQGALVPLVGSYTGAAPAALDYSIDNGATWPAVTGLIAEGGSWVGSGPIAVSTMPLLVAVRVSGRPAVMGRTSLIAVTPAPTLGYETLTVDTPSGLNIASPLALTGSYVGGPPLSVAYTLDGATWNPVAQYAQSGGRWSGAGAPITAPGGYVLRVRDQNSVRTVGATGVFVVASLGPGVPGLVVGLTAGNARFKSTSSHGVLVSSPSGASPAAMALYEQQLGWHTAATGSAPAFMGAFIDHTQARAAWAGNATFYASSWAASATAARMVPVLGVPLAASSEGANQTAAYQAVATGAYDAVYIGIATAWRNAGFPLLYARIGYEQNGGSYPWAMGSTPGQVAAWVAAYQRVSTVMREISGLTVLSVWNPTTVAWTDEPVDSSYPGDASVDVIGLSSFSPVYPNDLYDWTAGNWFQDPDLKTWAGIAANREHYWTYPSADGFNPLGRSYSGWGMAAHIAFAKLHSKPICIPAAGVGAQLDATTGFPVASQPAFDDGDFPDWLGRSLFAQGVPPLAFIVAHDVLTAQGDWRFSDPTVLGALAKPNARVSWRRLFSTYNAAGGTVDLNWTPPAGVAGPFTYSVQYRLSGGANWTPYGPQVSVAGLTVGGLAPGSLYDFRVAATNAVGQGPFSMALGIQVPAH